MEERETPRMCKYGERKDSNYNGNFTTCHCLSGTQEIRTR